MTGGSSHELPTGHRPPAATKPPRGEGVAIVIRPEPPGDEPPWHFSQEPDWMRDRGERLHEAMDAARETQSRVHVTAGHLVTSEPDAASTDTVAPFNDPRPAPYPGPVRRSSDGPSPAKQEPDIVVDLRPARREDVVVETRAASAALAPSHRWALAASPQGWVGDSAAPTWRPVVATTQQLSTWIVETYLGIVTAEVAVESRGAALGRLGDALARGRELATQGLVDEVVTRGGHAAIGVTMNYTALGERLLITVTGTAVTLRERG